MVTEKRAVRNKKGLRRMANNALQCAQAKFEILNARLTNFYDTASAGFVTISAQGLILAANLKIARLIGVERAELINQPFSRFILPKDRESWCLCFRQLLAAYVSTNTIEIRVLDNSGGFFWARVEASLVSDIDKSVVCHAVLIDITATKKYEEALEESETCYYNLINNLLGGIALSNEAGELVFANKAFADMVQIDDPTEVVGIPYLDFVHPEDRAESARRVALAAMGIQAPRREHRLLGVQGQTIFVVSTCEPMIYRGTKCVKGLFLDITERKQTEDKILRSAKIETALREIAETAAFEACLDEMYHEVHRLIGQIFPVENFNISLLNISNSQIEITFCADKTGIIPRQRPLGRFMTEYVMRQRKAILANSQDFARLQEAGEVDSRFLQWKEWMGAPLCNSRGEVFGVVSVFSLSAEQQFQPEDIKFLSIIATQVAIAIDRSKAEKALRNSEERLRGVLENSLNAIYKRNLKTGAYDYLSPAFFRMLEYTPGEFHALSCEIFRELVHDEDFAEFERVFAASMYAEVGAAFQTEYRIRHKNGQYRWVHDHFTLMNDPDGAGVACVGSIMDITDRKQVEEELHASEKKFRQLVQRNPIPLCYITQSGIVSYLNDRFVRTFGYALEDIPTLSEWWPLAYPDANYRQRNIARWEKEIECAMREDRDIIPAICNMTCKNGAVLTVETTGIIMGDSYLLTFIDITERRRNERLLKASYEQKKKNELFNELIQNKLPSNKTVTACARLLNRRVEEPFSCYLLEFCTYQSKSRKYWMDHGDIYQSLVDLVIDTLSEANCICWESNDGVGVLCFNELLQTDRNTQQVRRAQNLLQTIALHAPELDSLIGIAEYAESLTELGIHYQQALDALRAGRNLWPKRKIHHYQDIGIFQVLSHGNDQKQVEEYIDRTLGKLLEYDKKIKPELLKTLEVILGSDNLKEAADTLLIHYKTLMYRKQRIEKILGVSLDSFSSRMALAAAMHLMKLSEE